MAYQQAFVRFFRLGLFHVTFPLTPALSRRERENCAPSLMQSGVCPRGREILGLSQTQN